jgi:FMN reductase
MSPPRVIGVSGNLQRPSRTRTLVEAVGAAVARCTRIDLHIYDLLDVSPGLGASVSRKNLPLPVAHLLEQIESADALIVGSPTYKGSYSGLFKHLFDLVEPRALANKPVVLVATGGGPRHALVVEHSLRPLFGFFTALTVPTAVYASESDFRDGALANEEVAKRVTEAANQLVRMLAPAAPDLATPVGAPGTRLPAAAFWSPIL